MPRDTPNNPTQDYPFPSVVVDTIINERSSSFVGTFAPIEPGQPFKPLNHSIEETTKYAGMIFLGQKATKDNEFQERYWATQPHTQDIYNYEQHYSGESDACPIFTRKYLELRDLYPTLRRARLQPFTGLYAVTVTVAGSGYDPASPPAVTCSGGATAIAIVDPTTGAISKITLKAEGVNCTTVVTVAAPPAGGVQATAVGVLQPSSCILIKEDAVPAPEPWGSLYLMVERTYETFPGPIFVESSTDSTGIPMLTAKQRRKATDLFTEGEIAPSAFSVDSILDNGDGTATVFLTAAHELCPRAWVTFAGTNSVPVIDGNRRILSVPAANQVVISITLVSMGTMGGTMTAINIITREVKATGNINVIVKVDSMAGCEDVTAFNQVDVPCWKEYAFPDYLISAIPYTDISYSFTETTGTTFGFGFSRSWSGGLAPKIQKGYRGLCKAKRTRYFFMGPPDSTFANSIAPTLVMPSSGTALIRSGAFSTNTSVNSTGSSETWSISNSWRAIKIESVLTGPTPGIADPTIGVVNVSSISTATGGVCTVTLAAAHGMAINDPVLFANTNSTPTLDGVRMVVGVPSATQVEIRVTTTVAGTAAGTMTPRAQAGFSLDMPLSTPTHFTLNDPITLLDQPSKLAAGGVWMVDKYVILAPYTSGSPPP